MELKFIFMAVLACVSAVYLVSLFFKQGILQMVLKGCLVPLILAVYIFSAEKILVPIILALVLGWAGDIFLIKISDLRRFRLGLACFLLGHICYIIAMYKYTQPLHVLAVIICIAAAVVMGFCLYKFIRPGKEMQIPFVAYEIIIMTMAISAVQVFLVQGSVFGALVLAGSVCFVVSDSTLAFDTFRKTTKIGSFFVMLTYIAAQLMIALGFCAALV